MEELGKLEKVETAGYKGVWVSIDGDFGGAMGQEPKSDWALRGVVAEGPDGILTVKMLCSSAEVAVEEKNLRAFVSGLKASK